MKHSASLSIIILTCFLCCTNKNSTIYSDNGIKCNSIKQVLCKRDTTQSYSLYLPANYSTRIKWPVIFCFDPHGKGHIPLDSLKEAAEKYGYILAGSNSIRNGIKDITYPVNTLFDEILNNYSVDKNRIYVCGFSGGARVALSIAIGFDGIKGAICCGAGITEIPSSSLARRIYYYGIAGNEDFNYMEVLQSLQYNNPLGLNMIVGTFDGKHEWPSASILEKAVLWFTLEDMKKDESKKNKLLIHSTLNSILATASDYNDKQKPVEAFQEYQKGIKMLDGLTNIKKLIKESDALKESNVYKEASNRINKELLMESKLRTDYTNAMQLKDTSWWRNELIALDKAPTESTTKEQADMYKRVKNYLGMLCYMISADALNRDSQELAEKSIAIYTMITPENPDVYYMKTLLLLKQNNRAAARLSYKKCLEHGFTDFEKAKEELPSEVMQ